MLVVLNNVSGQNYFDNEKGITNAFSIIIK